MSVFVEAYKRGRAWVDDPEFVNLRGLDPTAVAKMDGSEADAKLLIRSLQLSDANYTPLVLAFHKRLPDFDGIVGEATKALVNIPRCPLPDAPPPPNASFHYEDPNLQKAVETMQAAATGSGSWPAEGCDPERPGVHSIRVRINPAGMPANYRAHQAEIVAAQIACSAEMGLAKRIIYAASGDCEISKIFDGLAGNTIGINEFPQSDTCNQTIRGWLDRSYDPSDWRYHAVLGEHEDGHGEGFNHTRGGVMNPSIIMVWPLSFKSGPTWPTAVRYFGGEPLTPPTPPVPPVPVPPPDVPQVADLQITFGGRTLAYEVRPRLVTVPPVKPPIVV